MSQVRFIGCLHLGDHWMALHRGFNDSKEHDRHLIQEWNKVVGKNDLTYILGDVTMNSERHIALLDRLNGRKVVVLGNHDNPNHIGTMLKHVESVAGMIQYKGYVLTHCPIHPNEMSFTRGNIHAHIHHNNRLDLVEVRARYGDDPGVKHEPSNYYNVDAHLIDYKPRTIDELVALGNTMYKAPKKDKNVVINQVIVNNTPPKSSIIVEDLNGDLIL